MRELCQVPSLGSVALPCLMFSLEPSEGKHGEWTGVSRVMTHPGRQGIVSDWRITSHVNLQRVLTQKISLKSLFSQSPAPAIPGGLKVEK